MQNIRPDYSNSASHIPIFLYYIILEFSIIFKRALLPCLENNIQGHNRIMRLTCCNRNQEDMRAWIVGNSFILSMYSMVKWLARLVCVCVCDSLVDCIYAT